MSFFDSSLYIYGVLPLLIFMARIMDVSIGTLRIVYVAKGKKIIAPILGFFEVLIWIAAMGKIMQNLDNIVCFIGYAGGFAAGNYVGMIFEEKLAMGIVGVRIITAKDASDLKDVLTSQGYGITSVPAEGGKGKVDIIFTTINRQDLPQVVSLIKENNPNAFYSVEDIKFVNQGIFPANKKRSFAAIKSVRKSK